MRARRFAIRSASGVAATHPERTADGPHRAPEGELQVERLLAELHQSEGGRFNDRRTAEPSAASSKPEESNEDEAPKMEQWQPEVMGQMVTAHNEIIVRAAQSPPGGSVGRPTGLGLRIGLPLPVTASNTRPRS